MTLEHECHILIGRPFSRAALADALADFFKRHERWPTGVRVHPTNLDDADAYLSELGHDIPVEENGGALAHEI